MGIIMLCSSQNGRHPRLRTCGGFSLAEVAAGIAILGLVAGSVLFGLNQLNNFATVNRLYTAAQTLAQNHIDLILTMRPFDPSDSKGDKYPVPVECGTPSSTNNILRTDALYYWNPTAAVGTCPMSTAKTLVPIYKDPMNGNKIVEGTIESVLKNQDVSVDGKNVVVRQASVTVAYKFRNTDYKVVMNTMRTSDK